MDHWAQQSKLTLERMAKGGVFLTVNGENGPNTMTMGWGSLSVYWGKPVLIIPVRESRYTHELLETAQEFTVSVPGDDSFRSALGFCGTHSGRDGEKYTAAGLCLQPGREVQTPVIAGCAVHYECRVLCRIPLPIEALPEAIQARSYAGGDPHDLFFGEIVAAYEG